MKEIALTQNTPEWDEFRLSHLGASDSASMMGIGYMTPCQLYLNKFGLYKSPVNDAMRRGHELEPLARAQFIKDTGIVIMPIIVESSEFPFMAASLDGIDEDRTFIVEIKTGGKKTLERIYAGDVPDAHYCQVQHQLFVTGLDKCIYYFFDGSKGISIEIYRNTKYITSLLEAAKSFWSGVLNFVNPPLTSKDYVPRSGEWIDIAKEWIALQKRMKEDEAREKHLREKLVELSQDQSSEGGGLRVSKIPRAGSVDYSAIPQLKDVNLALYRKPTTVTWRITKS